MAFSLALVYKSNWPKTKSKSFLYISIVAFECLLFSVYIICECPVITPSGLLFCLNDLCFGLKICITNLYLAFKNSNSCVDWLLGCSRIRWFSMGLFIRWYFSSCCVFLLLTLFLWANTVSFRVRPLEKPSLLSKGNPMKRNVTLWRLLSSRSVWRTMTLKRTSVSVDLSSYHTSPVLKWWFACSEMPSMSRRWLILSFPLIIW